MPRILVTGAGGFVGRHLVQMAAQVGNRVVAASRATGRLRPFPGVEWMPVDPQDPQAAWKAALPGCDTVIHLAARAHVLEEAHEVPMEIYREVNRDLAVSLARHAMAGGARRFVFVSSIGVNGPMAAGRPLTEADPAAPTEPYGVAKWEAEQALRTFAAASGLELVIVRPPLVYGPGAIGNFARLLDLVRRGLPLPLASVRNLRSLLGVWNLCDFLLLCSAHPAAAGETFVIADGEDISTPDLCRALAHAMGRRAWLLPCPQALLDRAGRAVGMGTAVERLCGSLQVDASKARRLLGWTPSVPLIEGLARSVAGCDASTARLPR